MRINGDLGHLLVWMNQGLSVMMWVLLCFDDVGPVVF